MAEIGPGQFNAKVLDYGVGKSKKGDPMAMIRFVFQDQDKTLHELNWYGSFASEKASEITCEALAVCGWSSNNASDLAKGSGSGVLDEKKVVSITLKNEEYDGKVRTKIAYVNPLGGSGFRDAMEHGEAVQAFSGLNIGGIAAAARNKHNKPIQNHAPGSEGSEPAPF